MRLHINMFIRFKLGKQTHNFHMLRSAEHIDRPCLLCLIPVILKQLQIPGQGFGGAGDVDDAFGFYLRDGADEGLCAAASGRIHEDDVDGFTAGGHVDHEGARIVAVKLYIFNRVSPGILHGIPHGVLVEFYADHGSGPGAGNEADGSDPAVGVEHRLSAGQAGHQESQSAGPQGI